MTPLPTNAQLGLALGVTAQRISVLRKDGMPTDTIEAALAWRATRLNETRRPAPAPLPASLDDGSLASTIAQHRLKVTRAGEIWNGAMEGQDPNQGKYQTAYNQSLKTLMDLEDEQERRLILAKDYISAKEAGEVMRSLMADVVNRLDKLALDVAEACNPENPAKAVKALEAWVRKTRADLSSVTDEG